MATALFLRDLLARADAQLVHAQVEWEAACEQARNIGKRTDWLADRPDLARLNHLIEDLPCRKSQLAQTRKEFQQAFDERVDERTKICPFQGPPELEDKIAQYRRVLQAFDVPASSELRQSLLREPRLELSLRAALSETGTSSDRARRYADRLAYARTKMWHKYYQEAMLDQDKPLRELIRSVREQLRRLEQERENLESDHARKIRSGVGVELGTLAERTVSARAALSEASEALSHRCEIDQHIGRRIEAFITDQTRGKREAYEAASRASEEARHRCISEFQSRLVHDFLLARIEDYVPSEEHPLRQELANRKTIFVREWAWEHIRSIPDLEQAAAIASVHHNVLVTARAGSGKTSTLITRVAFLMKHCRVTPNELLLLAFNRAAAEEMRVRLQELGCDVPHVMTFHALAYAVVHPEESLIYDSPDDTQ